ncbi:hypothetical protein [Gemmatimonas sp.]|uniref:hypothetical protein n=1 Tax=Gemmatimonas sp. TaxID=1962908 RepID=UPI003568E046
MIAAALAGIDDPDTGDVAETGPDTYIEIYDVDRTIDLTRSTLDAADDMFAQWSAYDENSDETGITEMWSPGGYL